MTSSFRLLDLPENARLHVLCKMAIVDLTCLSFCSIKAKDIIKSLNLNAVICPGFKSRNITWISLKSPNFYIEYMSDEDPTITWDDLCNYRPISLEIGSDQKDHDRKYGVTDIKWVPDKPSLFSDLVEHFLEIFHQREISLFITHPYFTEDSIIRTLGMYNMRHLDCWDSPLFEELIKRLPPPKQLDLFGSTERDEQYWKPEVYIQNYDLFSASGFVTLSFDDMLSMNAKIMEVSFDDINEKDLNLLVKFWIKGSLSRLEYISVIWQNRGDRLFGKGKILEGIKHTENPKDEERIFTRSSENWKMEYTEICKGGFDIRGRNGRRATIVLGIDHAIFEMFVWP